MGLSTRRSRGELMRRPALVTVLALLIAGSCAAAEPDSALDRYAHPGQLVDIGGRRINLRCDGGGPVTVVFESGLAFPSFSWRLVQPAISTMTRACSYDRAGLGFSDPGPLPRTAGRMADDLRAALRKAGIAPPYLLVASSMGSQPARLFAFRFPGEVGGLVMVDPYVEGQDEALDAFQPRSPADRARDIAADRACDADLAARRLIAAAAERQGCIDTAPSRFSPATRAIVQAQRLTPVTAAAAASERDSFRVVSAAEVRAAARPLGGMPIVVLTAGDDFKGEADEAEQLRELRRLHATIAGLSTRGEERLVPGATHVIQSSAPAAVIATIREMLSSVQPRQPALRRKSGLLRQ